jgi:hypothetical protein
MGSLTQTNLFSQITLCPKRGAKVIQVDYVSLGLMAFPYQSPPVRCGNRIAFPRLDTCFTTYMDEGIPLQVIRKERTKHKPFSNIFVINGVGRNMTLLHC